MALSPDMVDLMAECLNSTELSAKVFAPERFWRPFDEGIHGQIFDLIDHSDNPLKVIAAPRGVGKTSIINLLLPLKAILFQEARYIVPVSCTSDLAMQQAENLKAELISNEFINKLYGPLASSNFSKKQWVVEPGGLDICVMPRGAGQQIRGLLYRNFRPGLILVDDLEDPEKMDSEEQRAKKKEWFYADLLNCIDRGKGSKWQIIMLGTVLHQDSLLEDLLANPDWDSIRLEICDDDLKSTAPNFIPDEEIQKIYKQFKDAGKLDTFYREYRNNPTPRSEDATFPQSVFRYYDPAQVNLNEVRSVENVVIVDPAKTTNMKSADSAIVGVGVDTKHNANYVRDIVHGKFHPHELYDALIDMIIRINARVLGVEVTSLHEFITYPIKNELIRRGVHVEFVELHSRGGNDEKAKKKRIRSLAPFYRQGLMLHNPACTQPLEAQLMSFPNSRRWDIMDALGYLPELLEMGQRYMMPYTDELESQSTVESEFQELEDEEYDMPLVDFRIV